MGRHFVSDGAISDNSSLFRRWRSFSDRPPANAWGFPVEWRDCRDAIYRVRKRRGSGAGGTQPAGIMDIAKGDSLLRGNHRAGSGTRGARGNRLRSSFNHLYRHHLLFIYSRPGEVLQTGTSFLVRGNRGRFSLARPRIRSRSLVPIARSMSPRELSERGEHSFPGRGNSAALVTAPAQGRVTVTVCKIAAAFRSCSASFSLITEKMRFHSGRVRA